MDSRKDIDSLTILVKSKSGHLTSTINGLNTLSCNIEKSTGEKISISTLRRTLGLVKSEHAPSVSTLDILSRYVGFRSWNDFLAHNGEIKAQSQFLNDKVIRCDQLAAGSIVELEWAPARFCRLKSLGFGRFEVVLSINAKLAEGDTLCCKIACLGQPFVATDVSRGSRLEKVYVAGQESGITSLKVI